MAKKAIEKDPEVYSIYYKPEGKGHVSGRQAFPTSSVVHGNGLINLALLLKPAIKEKARTLQGTRTDLSLGKGKGSASSQKPLKHERLGLPVKRMQHAQTISRHPEIVKKAKAHQGTRTDLSLNSSKGSIDTRKEVAKAADG